MCVCGGASTRACAHAHEYEAQRLMPGAPSTTFHLFILRKIYLFLFYVWVFCLHICLCTTNAHSALSGRKRLLDLLELELQRVVICYVGPRNQI